MEIDEKTHALLAREPHKSTGNVAKIREHIAHNERSRKIRDIGAALLKELWNGQLAAGEGRALQRIVATAQGTPHSLKQMSANESLRWAEEHLFDRKSVVREYEIWRHALEHGRGCELDVSELKEASARRDYIRDGTESRKVTSREMLAREWDVLQRVKDGIGKHAPFDSAQGIRNPALDPEQREAVERILSSRDFVTLFRGGAGTGKSFALREVLRGLRDSGHSVQVIAPQRQQVIDLQRDGFEHAQTVSKTVDYVLFSDSAVKAATNRQQWYVTISRGRKGIRIFTSDARQLRENAARSGDRELAMDLQPRAAGPRSLNRGRLQRGISRGRQFAVDLWRRFKTLTSRRAVQIGPHEVVAS